jgi:hypothetical protein
MPVSISLLIMASLVGLTLLLCLRLMLVTRRLGRDIKLLEQELSRVSSKPETKASFSESLTQVERKIVQPIEKPVSSAEKYRYVASLTGQGVSAAGIASALQMAPTEVEQLMQLSRLKNQGVDAQD